jgi:hypothetical protein
MKKKTKNKLYKLLAMYPEDLSLSDWQFIHKHLTYEIVNKYIDKTGRAVLLPGITTDYSNVIKVPVSELLDIL